MTSRAGAGTSLRVALVHSFYRSANPSGENQVVRAELAALQRAGVPTTLVSVHTDEVATQPLYGARSLLRVATGRGRDPLDELAAVRPDVVHVHNVFPNWGREWVREVTQPLVHTLHNYRPICAAATLHRDGAICTECPDGDRWAGLRHGCYRGSRLATLPLTLANLGGPAHDSLLQRADRLLMLSDRVRQQYVAAGTPTDRMVDWSNFLPDADDPGPTTDHERTGWLVVARLGPEKGVLELVERWPASHRLTVVGDGEQLEAVRRAAPSSVDVRGRLPRDQVLRLMRTHLGLVVPSRWFEVQPLSYIEAIAAGLPVLAMRPNAVADLVERDGTGAAATWDDDLQDVLDDVTPRFRSMAAACRDAFERHYTESAHVERTLALYAELAA